MYMYMYMWVYNIDSHICNVCIGLLKYNIYSFNNFLESNGGRPLVEQGKMPCIYHVYSLYLPICLSFCN